MKNCIVFVLFIVLFLFNGCLSLYHPFKMNECDNTFWVNKTYKTELTLNQMAQKLGARNFKVEVDTLYSENRKRISPQLKILGPTINKQEENWIQFTVFESEQRLIFYGFCLKKPLIGTKKEQKILIDGMKQKIESEIVPLLF